MEQFTKFLVAVDDWVWGIPLIVLILSVGLFLTVRLNLLQVFHLKKALKYMLKNEKDGEGEVTRYYLIGIKKGKCKILDVYWEDFLDD